MPEIPCPTCGAPVVVAERAGATQWLETRCEGCGERIRYCPGSPAATAQVGTVVLVFRTPLAEASRRS